MDSCQAKWVLWRTVSISCPTLRSADFVSVPPVVPSNKPIVRTEKEIVLFVGPP
jgi:hypothetical protein